VWPDTALGLMFSKDLPELLLSEERGTLGQ